MDIISIKVRKTPHKGCPKCKKANHAARHKCEFCGYEFVRKKKVFTPN